MHQGRLKGTDHRLPTATTTFGVQQIRVVKLFEHLFSKRNLYWPSKGPPSLRRKFGD